MIAVEVVVASVVEDLRRAEPGAGADVGTLWHVAALVDRALRVLGIEAELGDDADFFLRCVASQADRGARCS